jgi:hypothetical protein
VQDFEIAAALRAKGTLIASDSWKIEMKIKRASKAKG